MKLEFIEKLDKKLTVKHVKVRTNLFISGILILAFCFSWISPMITSKVTGSNFIEIYIFFGIYLIYKSKHATGFVINSINISTKNHLFFFLIFCFGILGIFSGDNSLSYVYADLRSNLILLFSYLLFTSNYWDRFEVKNREDFVIYIYSLITIFDIFSILLRPYLDQTWDIAKQPMSILAPSLLSIFFFRKGKFLIAFLFIILMLYQAIVGFYRFYYLTVGVTGFLLVLQVLQNTVSNKLNFSNRLKSIILLLVIFFLVTYSISLVINYWQSDQSRMIHSINRTESLFENGAQSEKERMGSIGAIINSPECFIFPHGLGWRNFQSDIFRKFSDYHVISSMDSCFFYVAYHYGLITLIVLSFYLINITIMSLFSKKSRGDAFTIPIRLAFICLFLVSFSSHGIMFTTPQGAFVFGTFFALCIKPF